MAASVNLSVYKFTPRDDLPALRERLQRVTRNGHLRGTILLSPEGINLFVAGTRASLDALLATLRAVPGLADLAPKEKSERRAAVQPHARENQKGDHRVRRRGHRPRESSHAQAPRAHPQAMAG